MEEKIIVENVEVVDETKFDKVKRWLSEHITDVGIALLTFASACITYKAGKNGVDDYLYTEVDDEIYRIPVKQMKSTKQQKNFVKKSV